MGNRERILRLESALGYAFPEDYRGFIASHRVGSVHSPKIVSSKPDYWVVSEMFELGDGEDFRQLDQVYHLVGDVVPAGMVPVAEDHGGNLWLLDCRPGSGGVYWWDHERDLDDHRVEKAADSFGQFIRLLADFPDD